MESKPNSINELLGNLRRRVTELIKGDYSRGFKNEMATVKTHIESYSPEEIIKYLKPIYDDLISINDDIYGLVTDELYDKESEFPEYNGTGESKRDLMRKEVKYYKVELDYYIDKYLTFLPTTEKDELNVRISKLRVIKYLKYGKQSGNQNLRNLHNALLGHIDEIPFMDFKRIFSGEDQLIENPINWKGKKNEFKYFLKILFCHDAVEGKRIDWIAVRNCFRFNGEAIDGRFKSNSSDPSRSSIFNLIISNL